MNSNTDYFKYDYFSFVLIQQEIGVIQLLYFGQCIDKVILGDHSQGQRSESYASLYSLRSDSFWVRGNLCIIYRTLCYFRITNSRVQLC